MRERYRTLAAMVLCVAGTGLGCTRHLSLTARALLHSGNEAYKKGNYQTTVTKMDAFVEEAGRSRRAGEGYYLRALAKLKLSDTKGAKGDFSQAARRSDDREIRAHSFNALGDMAWNEGDMDRAGKYYAGALESTDRGRKPSDHSHYRLGCVFQRQGRWLDADLQFSRLDYFFRGTKLAMRAARRINCRAWTVQAGAFNEKDRADALAEELRGKNLAATVEPLLGREKPNFIVQVGRYAAYKKAVEALAGVRLHVNDAFVVTTRRP